MGGCLAKPPQEGPIMMARKTASLSTLPSSNLRGRDGVDSPVDVHVTGGDEGERDCGQRRERGNHTTTTSTATNPTHTSSSSTCSHPTHPPPKGLGGGKWPLVRPKHVKLDSLYAVGSVLGQGTSAVVREARSKATGEAFAIKIYRKSKLSAADVSALLEEVTILKGLTHPNVIRVHNFLEDSSHFYVVMELVKGGELFDRITKKSSYTEKEARCVFRTLCSAIAYMHAHNIIHRDLKPENLLLKNPDDDVTVKIADFGFAARLDGPQSKLTMQCGTPGYVAPEILRRQAYGKAVDMWSLGVITYILIGGYPPFYDEDQRKLFAKIRRGQYTYHPEIWGPVSKEAKDLISRMLCVDPLQRITANEALLHPWVLKDDESLDRINLENTKKELKKFNARRKFRAGVRSVMASNRFRLLVTELHKAQQEADAVQDTRLATNLAPAAAPVRATA